MSLLTLFFTSWIVGFSGAASPGPVSTFCLTEGARRGFWAGPRITLGHALIESAMVIALAFGLGPVLSQHSVAAVIALAGGVILLWMGIGLARGAWTNRLVLDLQARGEPSGLTRLGSVPSGALVTVTNPYWFLWWATIGAGYVVIGLEAGLIGLLAFFIGHLLADLTWNTLLTFIASSGRRVLPASFYRWLLIVFGLFLVGFSFYFMWTGIRFITG